MLYDMSVLIKKVKILKPEFTDRDAVNYIVNMDYVAEGLEMFGLDYITSGIEIFDLV